MFDVPQTAQARRNDVLAPCGGVNDTDDNDVKRGDDETGWLVNGITGSTGWQRGRNAIFIVSVANY